jgi:hypothetical protein
MRRSRWIAFLGAALAAITLSSLLAGHATSSRDDHSHSTNATLPTLPGQDAFGTIQEIVAILEANPNTDWEKVNLAALREHLIDMNEVTLNAVVDEQPIEGGLAMTVTGTGRTADSIRRMLFAHAPELDRLEGWSATTSPLPNGIRFTVTNTLPEQATRIRQLGLMGLLVSTSHHQAHHLAIAKGEAVH